MKENFFKKITGYLYHRGLQMLFMGMVTGFLAGVVVTFYNILASIGEGFSTGIYEYLLAHAALVPLLFVALVFAAFVIGVLVQFVPMIRGSGIPQTEGASRGVLRYNWFTVTCSMFAASLACIFLGLSAGGEGPSIQIGGGLGYGSSRLFSRTDMLRRYQITGGACAGLAVAFNAPLTGMAFAFEETHKKFTPEVFICAFSSVVTGVVTRNIIRSLLGLPTGATFTTFTLKELPYSLYGYLFVAVLLSALLGVGFYYLVRLGRKLFSKMTFFRGVGKMIVPFVLAGAFGLLTSYAMGGGHALIEALGTSGGERMTELVSPFGWGVAVTLAVALACKFIACIVNMSAGVPCGAFIPMLAIGAGMGALQSMLFCEAFGFDPQYSDLLVLICMAAFFTCVVRAPITGIVMVFELTWSFTSLLPVVVGVAVGYMVGNIAGTEPIYEALLADVVKERTPKGLKVNVKERLTVCRYSIVEGLAIKDVLWPAGTAVRGIVRGNKSHAPDAEFVLRAGDVVDIVSETPDPDGVRRELKLIFGENESVQEETLPKE